MIIAGKAVPNIIDRDLSTLMFFTRNNLTLDILKKWIACSKGRWNNYTRVNVFEINIATFLLEIGYRDKTYIFLIEVPNKKYKCLDMVHAARVIGCLFTERENTRRMFNKHEKWIHIYQNVLFGNLIDYAAKQHKTIHMNIQIFYRMISVELHSTSLVIEEKGKQSITINVDESFEKEISKKLKLNKEQLDHIVQDKTKNKIERLGNMIAAGNFSGLWFLQLLRPVLLNSKDLLEVYSSLFLNCPDPLIVNDEITPLFTWKKGDKIC